MDIDEPASSSRASSLRPSTDTMNILMEEKNLKLQGQLERERYRDLRN
jgi:hypothetical protein